MFLMKMIETPDINKEIHINSHSELKVKFSALKSSSKMFVVSKKYTRQKLRQPKYKRYMIKTKVNGISWIDKCDKKWKRNTKIKLTICMFGFVIIIRLLTHL